MRLFIGWLSGHKLELLLSVGALFAFFWLLHCRKRLRIRWPGALALAVLHTVYGVFSVSVFAIIEGFGDRSAVGNMSLFGGVFFMPAFYWAVAKWRKLPFSRVCDLLTPCMVFTVMCARINCILAGCCFGTLIPGLNGLRWPTRELEIIFYLFLLVILGRKVLAGKTHGEIYPLYMISYGVFRFIVETFRVSSSQSMIHLAHFWALAALCIGASVYSQLQIKKKARR